MPLRVGLLSGLVYAFVFAACAGKQEALELQSDGDRIIYENSQIWEADDVSGYPEFYTWSQAVGFLIGKNEVHCESSDDSEDPHCEFEVTTYNRWLRSSGGLCEDPERIGNQPTPPLAETKEKDGVRKPDRASPGTAFLVHAGNPYNSRTMLTAGHMFDDDFGCEDYVVIFDYSMPASSLEIADGVQSLSVSANAVYECDELLAHHHQGPTGEGAYDDFALFTIRPFAGGPEETGRWGVCLGNEPDGPEPGTEVYTAGHMLGLPLKYVFSGTVAQSFPDQESFTHNLSAFPGASGSFVMDMWHRVIGIHSMGVSPHFSSSWRNDGKPCMRVRRLSLSANDGPMYYNRATYVRNARKALQDLYSESDLRCPWVYEEDDHDG